MISFLFHQRAPQFIRLGPSQPPYSSSSIITSTNIVSFVSHQQAPQFIPSSHFQPPRPTKSSSSIIALSISSSHSPGKQSSFSLFTSFLSSKRLTSSTVHSFKSFSTSTTYTVFVFNCRIVHPFKSFTR